MQKYIPILLFSLLLLPATVSAATVSLHATPAIIGAGDTVRVDVLLDSAIPSNAFSGTISYSGVVLEPVSILDGNSIVSLWITRPTIPVADTRISFAGITPGGFSGTGGTLFSILFRAKAAGVANISVEGIEVLRNDGAGGEEPVTTKQLVLAIGQKSLGGYTEPSDAVPPEAFVAYESSDGELFDGKDYIVFTTVDKGSGVDYYSIAESRVPTFLHWLIPLSWSREESPYVRADQNFTSTIYIKAVDRAGNERLSVFPPRHLFTAYEVALLGILIGVVLLLRGRWGRRLAKNP